MVGVQDAATTFLLHATFEKDAEGRNANLLRPTRLIQNSSFIPSDSGGPRRHTLSGLCN